MGRDFLLRGPSCCGARRRCCVAAARARAIGRAGAARSRRKPEMTEELSGPRRLAAAARRSRPAFRLAALAADQVRITYVGHSTFLIESPQLVRIATDYNDWVRPPLLPDIVTMNHAHSTHYTDRPDPRHQVRAARLARRRPAGRPRHLVQDVRVRSVSTNIRNWSGGTERYGNSIFVFEIANLCIAHLGHLHHTLTQQQLDDIGRIDVVMAPVDGNMTLDLDGMVEVLHALKAQMIIPMHFFSTYTLDRFLSRMRQDLPGRHQRDALARRLQDDAAGRADGGRAAGAMSRRRRRKLSWQTTARGKSLRHHRCDLRHRPGRGGGSRPPRARASCWWRATGDAGRRRWRACAPRRRRSRTPSTMPTSPHRRDEAGGGRDRGGRAAHRSSGQQCGRAVHRPRRSPPTAWRSISPSITWPITSSPRGCASACSPRRRHASSAPPRARISARASISTICRSTKRYNGVQAYRRSKLYNIMWTRELARRWAGRGVTVNCFHPGFVATRYGDESGGLLSYAVRVAKRVRDLAREGCADADLSGDLSRGRRRQRRIFREMPTDQAERGCGKRRRRAPAVGRHRATGRDPIAIGRTTRLLPRGPICSVSGTHRALRHCLVGG